MQILLRTCSGFHLRQVSNAAFLGILKLRLTNITFFDSKAVENTPKISAEDSFDKQLLTKTPSKTPLVQALLASFLLIFSPQKIYGKNPANLDESKIVKSALTNYPKILALYEKIEVKEGGILEKEGYFDINLRQKYDGKTQGYYDGSQFDTILEKQNKFLGSKIYAGFRKSYGSYADYDRGMRTNTSGEYRVGTSFSLLQNRAIDEGRLNLMNSKLEREESVAQLDNIKIEIQKDALEAYYGWIIAGEIYKTHQQLLDLAEKRNIQLKIRAKKGDIAEIVVVENERNIFNRKSSVLAAKRDFENSALYLSLFYRNSEGKPLIPSFKELPSLDFSPQKISSEKKSQDLERALKARPELKIIKLQKEQEFNNLEQAKNLLSPKLDIGLENSKDLGDGPEYRTQTNNSVKLNFAVPLQRREAKGKITKSQSMIEALKMEEQLMKEKIEVELSKIQISVNNAVEIFTNYGEELRLSEQLAKAERERFAHGNSDFFLINLTEQSVANAKISQLKAFEEYQKMLASYRSASFELLE